LTFLLQLRYLVRDPELSHDQLTRSWIATVYLRAGIPAFIAAVSIAI
jgi:hypothetical protein